jgi:hypothetical protein
VHSPPVSVLCGTGRWPWRAAALRLRRAVAVPLHSRIWPSLCNLHHGHRLPVKKPRCRKSQFWDGALCCPLDRFAMHSRCATAPHPAQHATCCVLPSFAGKQRGQAAPGLQLGISSKWCGRRRGGSTPRPASSSVWPPT